MNGLWVLSVVVHAYVALRLLPGVAAASGAVPVKGPRMPVTVVVDRRPTWVGIDPYNKRIDRNTDDNLTPVDAPR